MGASQVPEDLAVPEAVPRGMADLVRTFDEDGFVNAGPLLEHSDVEELRAELERYADGCFRRQPLVPNVRPLDDRMHAFFVHYDLSKDPTSHHFQIGGLWQVSGPFWR